MTFCCQLDSNQRSYYGLQRMGSERVGWGDKRVPLANNLLGLLALLQMAAPPLFHDYGRFCSNDSLSLPLSTSATPHPTLRYPFYLSGEAHLHRLRGVIWGHAHTYHLAQRWPAHCARLRLWRGNRDQRVHEFSANHQGDAKAQRKLHLHRQQHRRHCQLGKTTDRYR